MTADQIVDVGAKRQDESLKSLARTLQTIEGSKSTIMKYRNRSQLNQ